MMFWDASAIIPLCVDEPRTGVAKKLLENDNTVAAWWGSTVECHSAFARLRREGGLNNHEEEQLRRLLGILANTWVEIKPSQDIKDMAARILLLHPLTAADSLQLAAALIWAGKSPAGHPFICLDRRLREAARKEGFKLLPEEMS